MALNHLKLVGITGGIGAGKSVVSRILRLKGYDVYDCDIEARHLMDRSIYLKQGIAERFGAECVVDGEIDRKAVAAHVFSDVSKLSWLNEQMHTAVREHLEQWLEQRGERIERGEKREEKVVVFVESAILSTSKLDRRCDAVWIVDAPEVLRIARASGRDGVDVEKIKERMEAQRGEFENFPADKPLIRIINDGVTPLLPQLTTLLNDFNYSI